MVTAAKAAIETYSFNGEAVGMAGASALRKVRSLAEKAPPGRLFAAISTLADASADAAHAFEAAARADLKGRTAEADYHQGRGLGFISRLKKAVSGENAAPLPDFMRKR